MFFLRFPFIFIFFRQKYTLFSTKNHDFLYSSNVHSFGSEIVCQSQEIIFFICVCMCVSTRVCVWVSEFDKWILKTNLTLNNNKRSWNNTCIYCTNWKSKRTKWLFIINRHHLYGWISIQLHVSVSSFKMKWNKINPRRKNETAEKLDINVAGDIVISIRNNG